MSFERLAQQKIDVVVDFYVRKGAICFFVLKLRLLVAFADGDIEHDRALQLAEQSLKVKRLSALDLGVSLNPVFHHIDLRALHNRGHVDQLCFPESRRGALSFGGVARILRSLQEHRVGHEVCEPVAGELMLGMEAVLLDEDLFEHVGVRDPE